MPVEFLLVSLMGAEAHAQAGWIYDGVRQCVFDENTIEPPTPCDQYHQIIPRRIKGTSGVWPEYRWMWKKGDRFEVRYTARRGIPGISVFTIGEISYKKSGSLRYVKKEAVSYSPSREEFIIGVPLDGYQFSMEGAL